MVFSLAFETKAVTMLLLSEVTSNRNSGMEWASYV